MAADVAAAERAAAAKLLADKRAAEAAAQEKLRRRCTALGLLQALTDANVADNEILKKATAFFDEHGIPSVSEMVKYGSSMPRSFLPGKAFRPRWLINSSTMSVTLRRTRTSHALAIGSNHTIEQAQGGSFAPGRRRASGPSQF